MKKSLLFFAGLAVSLCAVAQTFESGTEYYIRNVKTGMWLNGGYSWGTKGILKPQARAFELVQNGDAYVLKSSCGYVKRQGGEIFIDGGQGDATKMTVKTAGEGVYTISDGSWNLAPEAAMLTYGGTESWESSQGAMHSYDFYPVTGVDNASDEAAAWQILTRQEMIAELASATSEAPKDATFLIKAHMMDVNDGDNTKVWLVNGEADKLVIPDPGWGFGANSWINNGRYGWFTNDEPAADTEDVISQTVEGAPEGSYTVEYRVVNQANTPMTVNFNTTAAEATAYESSDLWYGSAYDALKDQANIKTADFTVGKDGKLAISMNKESKAGEQNRFAFKSFILKYKGNSTSGIGSVETEDADAPEEFYTLQGIRVAQPSAGLYIVKKGGKATKRIVR